MIIKNELENKDKIKAVCLEIDTTLTRVSSISKLLMETLSSFNLPYLYETEEEFLKATKDFELFNSIITDCDYNIYASLLQENVKIIKKSHLSGKEFLNKLFEILPSYIIADEHLKEIICTLANNYTLYCYSNWWKEIAYQKLAKFEILDYFKNIYAFENNSIKFSSMGLERILTSLKLNSEEIVHVTNPIPDLLTSKKLGVQNILIDYKKENQKYYDSANSVITEFNELKRVLK